MDVDKVVWNIIDTYFKDNPDFLIKHQTDSYNLFFSSGIKQIFKERNPIRILKEQDPKTKQFAYECNLYLAGKSGDRLYYGKPIIYDDNDNVHFMYPNEARLRNMTYGFTIHYDVEVDFTIENDEDPENPIKTSITLEKILLGKFPIMMQSNFCILKGLSRHVRFNMGECRNDPGGYFIIDGKEKSIVCQEKFADNMLYIRDKVNDLYTHSAEIRSVSEDASKPIRTVAVRMVASTPTKKNEQIVVNVPNVRKPVPLFIVMRALGIISDHEIVRYCLLDLKKNEHLVDSLVPCVYDAGEIFTQEAALKYMATLTKGKTVSHVMEILMNYFLPHVSITNLQQKAFFLGYIVFRLLRVVKKEEAATDRDNFKYKRVELTGNLLHSLFTEYYKLQERNIFLGIDKEYFYKKGVYQKNFISLIQNNYQDFFKERIIETGFRKAFKGNWGAETHTKRAGIVQDLNRLSFNSAVSQLRKLNLDMDASAKVVGPRLCHGSQWGIIDPVDTPDGGNVGLHKHLAMTTHITKGCSGFPMINWLRENSMQILQECSIEFLSQSTKVFVNGSWCGVVSNPIVLLDTLKFNRRLGLIPVYTSFYWNIPNNEIMIYTDSGRLCRPLFYVSAATKTISYDLPHLEKKLDQQDYSWQQLFTGFIKKQDPDFHIDACKIYTIKDLYGAIPEDELDKNKGIIEYIDTAEHEGALVSVEHKDFTKTRITNVEIHPSLMLGVMGNQVVFPEHNQLPRDLFSCGQSKQAVSMYHSNFQNRIDKMGVILNYGQMPLIKSRYLKYIHNEEHPYGENPIVAIMCYNGYNVEDAILFNEGSIKRGMFRTTYFNMYEAREENSKVAGGLTDTRFTDVQSRNVAGLKPGVDYSYLDKHGLVEENTLLNDKIAIIGKVSNTIDDPDTLVDSSITPKKGQLGYVDKSFITEGEEGFRIAKVRIREERIPAIGDKFCSRCGQKGTVGLVIPEENMPFSEDGLRPDIIVNPHALPSRMTIGQLVECVMGKACVNYGGFGDCTAFVNKGPKHKVFGKLLTKVGYHSSGNQILYNGMTGEQLETEIFFGPTYYMRLKHMVKDKINYRARGPRTMLTRQTVQGRANDGGLRIGEMERDCLIAHGVTNFLQESMLVRGDDYYMAVCNKTGTIAVYNESKNIFLSPMADGPIQFTGTITEEMNIQTISRYGKDFSVVRVPYSFKLLMQELQTMNVQMRIITEDNIDQVTTMGYSDNISKLLHDKNVNPSNIASRTESNMRATRVDAIFDLVKMDEDKDVIPDLRLPTPDEAPEGEQKFWQKMEQDKMVKEGEVVPAPVPYVPTDYIPGSTPTPPDDYVPGTPDSFGYADPEQQFTGQPYMPTTPPSYAPTSPPYPPNTPPMGPTSPSYAPVSPPGPPTTPPGPPVSPPMLSVPAQDNRTPSPYYPTGDFNAYSPQPMTPPGPPMTPPGPPMTPITGPQSPQYDPDKPPTGSGSGELQVKELSVKKEGEGEPKLDTIKLGDKQSGGNTKSVLFNIVKDDDTK